MVCFNKQTHDYSTLEFTHFVEVPSCTCVIATAREQDTHKTKLFLIIHGKGRIYIRKGLNSIWVELDNENGYHTVCALLSEALQNERIPRYSTNSRSALN